MPKPEPRDVRRMSAEERRAESQRVRGGKRKHYRVRANHTVQLDGMIYEAGEEIELTEEQAKGMPWAVVADGERVRAGQTSRLKAQIAELESQIAGFRRVASSRRKDGKPDPELEQALESIRARGDNHEARGEPHFGQVPKEVEDRHFAAADAEFVSAESGGVDVAREDSGPADDSVDDAKQ